MHNKISTVFSFLIIMLLVSSATLVHGELFAPKRVDADKIAMAKESYNKAYLDAKKMFVQENALAKNVFDNTLLEIKDKYSKELSEAKITK